MSSPQKRHQRRKICIVTGTRAEYGLLRPLMREVASDPALELQVAVTGSHLSKDFGLTVGEIERDGFPIACRVKNQLASDTGVGMAKSTALALSGLAVAFERVRPDIVVVLGDRYETFAAAQAALMLRIPVAHLHGGETTEGAIDEAFRHGITKIAALHFTAAAAYRKRVIQMGENPRHVFNVGAIGVDNIRTLKLLSARELQKDLGVPLGSANFLVTYHPATLGSTAPEMATRELLSALDLFPQVRLFFTQSNADAGGRAITRLIQEYVKKRPDRASFHVSLGQVRYLSLMSHCDAVIGNSSSGIFEAPYLRVPSVNVGERQKGRLMPASVLCCAERKVSIAKSIEQALAQRTRKDAAKAKLPFGDGHTARTVRLELKRADLESLHQKRFYDL